MAVVYVSVFELGQKEFLSINVGTILQVPLLSCTCTVHMTAWDICLFAFCCNYTVKKYLKGIF